MDPIGMAVLGAGYWGPNLIRNIRATEDADLRWVCDLDLARAERAIGPRSTTGVTVARRRSRRSRRRGGRDRDACRHACRRRARVHRVGQARDDREAARALFGGCSEARRRGRDAGVVLMCDHTYCYTPAVRHIRSLVAAMGARRPPVLRLGADQPRARPAGRRRLLGPRAARPVDPRLRPARGVRVEAVAAQGADPIGGGSGVRRLPDAAALTGRIAHVT